MKKNQLLFNKNLFLAIVLLFVASVGFSQGTVVLDPNSTSTKFFYLIANGSSNRAAVLDETVGLQDGNEIKFKAQDDAIPRRQVTFKPTGDGYFYILNQLGSKVFKGKDTQDNSAIAQYDIDYSTSQQWSFDGSAGDGWYFIKNRSTNKYMYAETDNDNAIIRQNSSIGGNLYKWRIQPAGNVALIPAQFNKFALEIAAGSTSNGALAQLALRSGTLYQVFAFTHISEGYYKIVPQHATSMGLDVASASTANGTSVCQWAYGGGTNEQFRLKLLTDGTFAIVPRHSGMALGYGNTDNITPVLQWELDTNNVCQRWNLVKEN